MKIKIITILVVVSFFACSKENTNTQTLAVSDRSGLIKATDTAKIPLNDLGAGTFYGYVGGLYPGGVNKPSGQYGYDLIRMCKLIEPLDTFGNPSPDGKIVFISLGSSTSGHNMELLKTKTAGNPLTNPQLLLLKCSNGKRSASLNSQMNPDDSYWDHVTQIITGGAHSSYRQVQVIYLEADDSSKNNIIFPQRAIKTKEEIKECLRVYKKKFPNLKIVYVLARTRTFGNQILYNREPAPYYFGWACKWAIEDQINGVPGTEYKGKKPVAPMLTWGFYQWADSLPRITDNFYWRQSETRDGLHADDAGQDTLTTRFQNFLLTDKGASIWYAAH
jgi:hypothetical protein